MKRLMATWLALGLGAFALPLAGCDDSEGGDIQGVQVAEIQANPGSLVFPKVAPGDSAERTVQISNVSDSTDLIIDNIDFEVGGNQEFELFFSRVEGGDQFVGVSAEGEDSFPYPITIPAQHLDLPDRGLCAALRGDRGWPHRDLEQRPRHPQSRGAGQHLQRGR
jgi:hypothetical protein